MNNTLDKMPGEARLWVHQSNRALSVEEVNSLKDLGTAFVADWAAHGASLNASFTVLHNVFVVIAVDEAQATASGCSIDKAVHFVQELEKQFNLNFFDRMQVAYRSGDEIQLCSFSAFEALAKENKIDENTVVFNNMVSSKQAFDTDWEVPLKNSWQNRVL